MELTLSILVFLSVYGCTLSAPPPITVATTATTLTLQPSSSAENNIPVAAVDNSTPAAINDSSSDAKKVPSRVAFVIPAKPKTNKREKKSTSSGTCTTVDGPNKQPFNTVCNNGALSAGNRGGDSSHGHLSGSDPSSLPHFGELSHFNSGAGPSHTISGVHVTPQAPIHPLNLPFGPYAGVISYGLPGYQGLPISGAFELPGQDIGLLSYEHFGGAFPITYYKTSDSTETKGEEINLSQKGIQAELARQQAETKMRDAAALEEANMSLLRSGSKFYLPPVPVIDNFLPTIPMSNGQQLRGVFPSVPAGAGGVVGGGGCGAIPLLMSCSPRLVSGSLVGTHGYGSGVYGGSSAYGENGAAYYGGGYQFTPWLNGIPGGYYRQENTRPTATPSPIPIDNTGAKKMEKPDQNSSKGGAEKKSTALSKNSTLAVVRENH